MGRAVGVALCNVVVAVLTLAVALAAKQPKHPVLEGQHAVVQNWAEKLGEKLSEFASSVTRIKHVHDTFNKATVSVRNATTLLDGVVRSVQDLMQVRVEQVQDIRQAAEELGRTPLREMTIEARQEYLGVKEKEATEGPPPSPEPKKAKKCRVLCGAPTTPSPVTTPAPTLQPTSKPWLVHSDLFPGGGLINDSLSAVHVPADVNDGTFSLSTAEPPEDMAAYMNSGGADVLRVIKLTSGLDDVFIRNKDRDKTTSWQFFAHYSGVMRQYPASDWGTPYREDFYDARLRPWYLGAAMSPKDMVILLDNSGSISMTEPSLLTKLVVRMLLDTLGPDDFVTVLLYNDTVIPLVPGLNLTLIPATSAYVRELQHALLEVTPKGPANLTLALETAFRLLEKYRRQSLGAACNQAVMLVTDIVPEHEEELFRLHNRLELDSPGQAHARVFTFVVEEPAHGAAREAQWMACANMGWHMKIWKYGSGDTIQYLPVMSRPLVLAGRHPVHWTHVYADVTVPGITDKLWSAMEHDEQLRRITPFCFKHTQMHTHPNYHLPIVDKQLGQEEEFVITVSVPARNLTREGIRNGDILGVAGIDIPIAQIRRLIPHHKVGVNAYIFMVTNNGLVVFHPEMRPRFNGILKPGYNSVDMTELEQEDVPYLRNMSESMRELRELVVNQTTGSVVLSIRQVYDNWHRVSRWNRRYHFQGVPETPYSMVMAVPEHDYGSHRLDGGGSVDKLVAALAAERNWAVHPGWHYCPCCGLPGRQGLHSRGVFARGLQQGPGPGRGRCARCEGAAHAGCADTSLAAALALDVDWTKSWYAQVSRDASADKRWQQGAVSMAFMATHSGLTRWVPVAKNTVVRDTSDIHVKQMELSRGPDEVWYRRAVESAAAAATAHQPGSGSSYQLDQVDHWVVSVPLVDEPGADVYSEYNAAYNPDNPWSARLAGLADHWSGRPAPNLTDFETLEEVSVRQVTMTAAVFKKKAPAAVAGFRFPQGTLQSFFERIVGILDCRGTSERCGDTCASEDLDCYLVDEHGIVVADESGLQAGRPLARVNGDLMVRLEAAKVFQRVTVSDYQGVCRRSTESSAGPVVSAAGTRWFGAGAALAALWWRQQHAGVGAPHGLSLGLAQAAAWLLGAPGTAGLSADAPTTPEYKTALREALKPIRVNKTTLQLCDMKVDLHRLGPGLQLHHRQALPPLSCDKRSFAAAAVPGTNLVLVTALSTCPGLEQLEPFSTEPWEAVGRQGDPVFRKQGLLWPRRRPATVCYREHAAEKNITQCGGAHRQGAPHPAALLAAVLVALPALAAARAA
ncbi:Voltage-dependent calcium channel subunit alpha-2/delta-4 [Frankliniella fusca]|uniref:Voltage-dependent calcium channel subunit alpha-2/delta-4 n=1 Tax=Frankliniella fusca TaxID=407009 RepID=A0AAE1HW21_9NEOP|nr:Voltage-dependent calcium channel subunit alpha-2/delta-4 [Frankliniella fusca]